MANQRTPKRSVQVMDKLLAERIKRRRNELGMTQHELGIRLGVSFQQVQKYEKGMNRVPSGRLIQIAKALQCSITDLTDGMEDGKSAQITPASQFAASRDGVALLNAVTRIVNRGLRRQVIRLVKTLSAVRA
jgi:transcriptional regulator with XRE-family HTH domain